MFILLDQQIGLVQVEHGKLTKCDPGNCLVDLGQTRAQIREYSPAGLFDLLDLNGFLKHLISFRNPKS